MNTDPRMLLEEAIRENTPSVVEATTRVLQQTRKQPVKRIIMTRALNGLASLLELSPPEDVADASSDLEVLLRILEMPESVRVLSETDPLAAAKVRGLRAREQLLNVEGGVVSSEQAADLLHMSRQGIDKRRKKGQLIGLSIGRRGYVYPVWQFVQGGTLPGLESVLSELRDHDAWMQTAFMVNANTRLNRESPLAKLRCGHLEEVRQAAREYGNHGAA